MNVPGFPVLCRQQANLSLLMLWLGIPNKDGKLHKLLIFVDIYVTLNYFIFVKCCKHEQGDISQSINFFLNYYYHVTCGILFYPDG